MKVSRIAVAIIVVSLAVLTNGFTQGEVPTPSLEQQTQFKAAMKDVRARREALKSAATTKLSLVNCGQLMLAQSQLETADVRLQLVMAKIASQLGLDSARYEAIEDKDGNLLFRVKSQASPAPN